MQHLPIHVPDQFRFQRPVRSPDMRRDEEILRPLSSNYSTAGDNVIRFVLPKKNIDFRQGHLSISVRITTVGSTYQRLCQGGAMSCINKIRWAVGSVEETTEYYNRIQNMLYNSGVPPDVISTVGQDLLGYGTQAERNAYGTGVTEYSVPVNIGIFNQGALPLAYLERDCDFIVEFYMENPLWVVESDGTSPVIEFINVRWHYHALCSSDGSYESGVQSDVASGKLQLAYGNWAAYQSAVNNNIVEARINWNGNSLASIINYFFDQSSLSDMTVNDKFTTWIKTFTNGTTIQDFQLQLKDGMWVPSEAIICSGSGNRAFHTYLDWKGLWNGDAESTKPSPIDLDSFNQDQFLMVNNLTIVPTDYKERRFLFNQLSTMTSSNNTLLRVNLTGVPPAQIVVYHFVNYGCLLNVSSNGKIRKHF